MINAVAIFFLIIIDAYEKCLHLHCAAQQKTHLALLLVSISWCSAKNCLVSL
jgi:hypothetical protein